MEELKNYICKSGKDWIIIAVGGMVFAVPAIVFYFQNRYVLMGLFAVMSAILFYSAITGEAKEKEYIKSLEDSADCPRILSDFASAQSFADDALRLGRDFIFRKKYTEILRYEDIKRAEYVEHLDADHTKTERKICLVLSNGKSSVLCNLYANGYSEKDMIMHFLKERNASIEIKY